MKKSDPGMIIQGCLLATLFFAVEMISVEVPLRYSLHDVIIMVHSPASRRSIGNGSHQWMP